MDEEFNSLWKNTTWELVSLPLGRKLVQCKWEYRENVSIDGSIFKCKEFMAEKWFSQVQGVYFHETFALVAKMDSIRLILAITTSKHWEVHHMDVKSDFLHGELNEEIYTKNPEFYILDPSLVSKLQKSLYGLKQAPRSWYAKMDAFLLSQYFQR